jgi:hypothetical protein
MQADLDTFRRLYESELEPHLVQLEEMRKRALGGVIIAFAAIGAVVGGILLWYGTLDSFISIFAVVIGLIAGGVAYGWLTSNYRNTFKAEIVHRLVEFVSPELHYDHEDSITEPEFRASLIFSRTPDRFKGEDLVWGNIGATQLKFSECHAEYKTKTTDSKGNTKTTWHTIFKGVFFIADFNKHFQGATIVQPDTAQRLLGRLGQKLQSWGATFNRGELVKLEDPEFEREFAVYADDQIEARYILSTSLMQRILQFKAKTGRNIYLSFVNSSVNVAISTSKNLFEPPLLRTVACFDTCQEYLEDLTLVTGIVEDLNLNTRIWSKQA